MELKGAIYSKKRGKGEGASTLHTVRSTVNEDLRVDFSASKYTRGRLVFHGQLLTLVYLSGNLEYKAILAAEKLRDVLEKGVGTFINERRETLESKARGARVEADNFMSRAAELGDLPR